MVKNSKLPKSQTIPNPLIKQVLPAEVEQIFNSNIELALICKNIRATLCLTQKEMAARLKTKFRTYQDWEGGKAEPNGQVAFKLFLLSSLLYKPF